MPSFNGPGTCFLYTWFSSTRGDHFTTSDPAWIGKVGELRTSGDEYELMRIEGRVFSPEYPQPRGTVPLKSYWNPERGDNFMTTQQWNAAEQGYVETRLEGYLYQFAGEDRMPLESYWNAGIADNLTTSATPAELFSFNDSWLPFGTQGYLLPPIERVVSLNTWYSAARRDHHTTTDPAFEGVVGDRITEHEGYEMVRAEGRIFSPDVAQPRGTLPLWNFWNPERRDSFITTQPHLIRVREQDGYVRARLEGFVYADPGPGRRELASHWNAAALDNATTTARPGEIRTLTSQWTRFRTEGFLFPRGELVRPIDITDPLVPSALLEGDREFHGHGPDVTARLRLVVDPSGRNVVAKIHIAASETTPDWSRTEGNWDRVVYTAPPGRRILAIASPAVSEVRFISDAAGAQFLFPGEDLRSVTDVITKVSEFVVGVLQFVPKAGDVAKVAHGVLSGLLWGANAVGYSGNTVYTVVSNDGPVMFFAIVGDTGGPDISDDDNPKDDTRIVAIRMLEFEVVMT